MPPLQKKNFPKTTPIQALAFFFGGGLKIFVLGVFLGKNSQNWKMGGKNREKF